MMVSRTLSATLLAVTFSLFGTSAFAAGITIVNWGFEDPVSAPLDDGDFRYEVPNGWTAYDPVPEYCPCPGDSGFTTPWYNLGTINPDGTTYSDDAPEGDNVGFVYIGVGDGAGFHPDYPLGLQQTLSTTLQANSKYKLEVEVGNAADSAYEDFTGFGGYRIELLAGDIVLDVFHETTASPDDGFFEMASISVVTGDLVNGSIAVGSDLILASALLGIRLIHENDANFSNLDDWASEIAFDDVQLSVSAVPVPAAAWLFGTALIGLVGFGKRRKTAQPA